MKMSPYAYAEKDFRTNPDLYMYAPIQGGAFLKAFKRSREEVLSRVSTHGSAGDLAKALSGDATIDGGRGAIRIRPSQQPVQTEKVLKACLHHVLTDRVESFPIVDNWVDIFLRKIEIPKRLYVAYDADLTPLDRKDAGDLCYALFAALLALRLDGGTRMKRLNALLKVNDFLIHRFDGWRQDAASGMCVSIALTTELEAVGTLASAAGVSFDGA